ncbi:MAG: response regulator, partial [Candidatus Aminicenantes bacterium]|nr:response regulator [Candidatus Aminicenantes bacterium]
MNEQVNILIIDDEETIRDSCSQVLLKEGFRVRTAKDGTEGLDAFKKGFFHLVLLDLKLPGVNGMQLLNELKKENPDTPI